jgi:hypothetical protein
MRPLEWIGIGAVVLVAEMQFKLISKVANVATLLLNDKKKTDDFDYSHALKVLYEEDNARRITPENAVAWSGAVKQMIQDYANTSDDVMTPIESITYADSPIPENYIVQLTYGQLYNSLLEIGVPAEVVLKLYYGGYRV